MNFKRRMNIVLFAMVLLAAPWGFAQRPSFAPDFTLKDLNGKEYSLSQYRGKVVLLNFWVTWCPPCRVEMSELQKAYQKIRDKKEPVLLTVNIQEPIEVVKKFSKELGLTFPILTGATQGIAMSYRVDRFPVTFLIDPDGNILRVLYGPITYERVLQYVK